MILQYDEIPKPQSFKMYQRGTECRGTKVAVWEVVKMIQELDFDLLTLKQTEFLESLALISEGATLLDVFLMTPTQVQWLSSIGMKPTEVHLTMEEAFAKRIRDMSI